MRKLYSEEQIDKAIELYRQGVPVVEIAKQTLSELQTVNQTRGGKILPILRNGFAFRKRAAY